MQADGDERITLSTNTTVSHTAYDGRRRLAGVRSGAMRAAVIAKVTTVTMAESPSSSARIHTPKAPTNCMMMALGMSVTRSTMRM